MATSEELGGGGGGDSTPESSLPPTLAQLEHERLQQQPRPPPLAHLEEFSGEDMLTEDEMGSDMPNSEDMLMSCNHNGPVLPASAHFNGSVESGVDHIMVEHTTIDMNGNGYHQHKSLSGGVLRGRHQWLEQKIQSTLDLEKVFLESDAEDSEDSDIEGDWDLLDFAERYYNVHTTNTGYTGAISKTVNIVRKKSNSAALREKLLPKEIIPMEDLVRFTKNSHIPNSLLHLQNMENSFIACSIFKDLCKYMKGETKGDAVTTMLQSIVGYGIERTELRDEIYCQIMRQLTDNHHAESAMRGWIIMVLCCVAFHPSRTLKHYLESHLRRSCDDMEQARCKHAAFCLRLLQKRRPSRSMPPSAIEIEAVSSLQPLVYRIYCLDGKTKAISLDPTATVQDALEMIQDKLGLASLQGWVLFESIPEHDRCTYSYEYLADIVARWEEKANKKRARKLPNKLRRKQRQGSNAGTPKKGSLVKPIPIQNYGKLVFCKRIYQRFNEVVSDPVEYHLLYAQAQHYVVQIDEYAVSAAAAVHLAGLQAQIEFGEFDEEKMYRYQDVGEFLCQRVLCSSSRDWSIEIAAAHKRYGRDKTANEAKVKYVSIVSQFPLYGCTKIFAHYRGIWQYGVETILAISYDGIKFISLQEKTITLDLYFAEIEHIILNENHGEYYVIIQLKNLVPRQARQKCYMFECLELEDFAALIEAYSPGHAKWLKKHQQASSWKKKQFHPSSDWIKLYDDILMCRRLLVTRKIMQAPTVDAGGLLKTALIKSRSWICRLSGRNTCGLKMSTDEEEDEVDVHSSYWSFTRQPFKTSLLNFATHELEDVSARMFNSTLVYTGLESAAILEDMDLIVVVQTLIIKCMENKELCNEFYLQLIRQTTDTQTGPSRIRIPLLEESNQKATIRYWHLMTMATCVMHPPNPIIFNYLNLHLKLYAMEQHSEEGKYALFCIKSLYRTCEKQGRKYPPSFKEIAFVTKRQAIEARVHLQDGHQMLIEFDSAATADEVMQLVKAKAGMRLDSEGFGIYHIIGHTDECILPEETLADSLYKWERWSKGSSNADTSPKDLKFMFRKRLFIEPYFNIHDPVEIDLMYNQSVTDVFEEKIPLTKQDAIQLCALRAQTEFGDYTSACVPSHSHSEASMPFSSVMRILPRHLRDLVHTSEIITVYKTLLSLSPIAANLAFMDILKEWPLYGATMFEVTQSHIGNLPKTLWLAVSQLGVHLMEIKGQNIYVTYPFQDIREITHSQKNLSFTLGTEVDAPSVVFHTTEGNTICRLIEDYKSSLEKTKATQPRSLKDKGHGKKTRGSQEPGGSKDSLVHRAHEPLSQTNSQDSFSHERLHKRDLKGSGSLVQVHTKAGMNRSRDHIGYSKDSLTYSKDNLVCSKDSLVLSRESFMRGELGSRSRLGSHSKKETIRKDDNG